MLFSPKYIESIIENVQISSERLDALKLWQNEIIQELNKPKNKRRSEKEMHEQFFTDVFEKALGYKRRAAGSTQWTITSEYQTDIDATRSDGCLGFFKPDYDDQQKDEQAVIELKSLDIDLDLRQNRQNDRRTPVEQAFSYAHKFDNVKWVIVSNYSQVRLYPSQSSKYHLSFDLSNITHNGQEKQLKLFFLLLSQENLIATSDQPSLTTQIFKRRQEELQNITTQFYNDYKEVRHATAKEILIQSDYSVDHSVSLAQTILDRIIFIAFLESLSLIPKGTIEDAYSTRNKFNPTPIWDNFKYLFNALDKGDPPLNIPKYNGGLFKDDEDIQKLNIPDELLAQYRNFSRYDFLSELRVDILGHIFEQSITDLNILKADLRGEENTDTSRHDEGAYYTPDNVTHYILERTIGVKFDEIKASLGFDTLAELKDEWLIDENNKTRAKHMEFWQSYQESLSQLKILDPSCGSGAFLVAAFDHLLAEYKQIHKELDKFFLEVPLFDSSAVERGILQNNLYGVDISYESVEITKLSLWLKIATHKKPLTALDNNIKMGNSLIENKQKAGFYYKDKGQAKIEQQVAYGEDEFTFSAPQVKDTRIKALGFDWKHEFSAIFAQGGFDIIIGNPPYIRHELLQKNHKEELKKRFKTATGTTDLYVPFYELGYNLLKNDGMLGFITSNKWMRAKYGEKLRDFIKSKTSITHLLDLTGHKIFEDAIVHTNILIFRKQVSVKKHPLIIAEAPFDSSLVDKNDRRIMQQNQLQITGYHLESNPLFWQIKQKIETIGTPLKQWEIKINRGILTGYNEAFIIDNATKEKLVQADATSIEILKPLLRGRDIKRWHADWHGKWLIFVPWHFPLQENSTIHNASLKAETLFKQNYSAIYNHLLQYKDNLEKRNKAETGVHYEWYALQRWGATYHQDFEQEKIIYSEITKYLPFIYDDKGFYTNNKNFILTGKHLKYLTAYFNSSCAQYWIKHTCPEIDGPSYELRKVFFENIPVPMLSPQQQQPFITLSEKIHALVETQTGDRQKFINLLVAEFPRADADKLTNWHQKTFADLLASLKKSKVTLTGALKEDWLERYDRIKTETDALTPQITAAEQQLNQLTYQLYGLTADEIKMIEAE